MYKRLFLIALGVVALVASPGFMIEEEVIYSSGPVNGTVVNDHETEYKGNSNQFLKSIP